MALLTSIFLVQAFALAQSAPPHQNLEQALQQYLDTAVMRRNVAVQLTYKDSQSEISIASGNVGSRAVTPNDTFLFGSGTKPLTAALVLKRVEQGRLGLNDTVAKYLDVPFKQASGQSFLYMFGPNAKNLTIWHLLTMQAGLPDFDVEAFDEKVLLTATTQAWTPLELVQYAAKQAWPCQPGQCVFYSSTNYILLGFVLLILDGKRCADWASLRQSMIASEIMNSSNFANDGLLNSSGLTVPGQAAIGNTIVYGQRADILGWTCGNLLASSHHMARFMWELLVAKSILSESMLSIMTDFRDFSFGFGKAGDVVQIRYGAGLMAQQADYWKLYQSPWEYGDWGTTMGHGGDTYGFVSDQGFIPQLNATWSWVSNTENVGMDVSYFITCNLIKIAARVVLGVDPPPSALHCDYSLDDNVHIDDQPVVPFFV